ncbi:MAG: hypothetical protein ACHQ0J_15395, partial [Candidatus Dormibacterales bacterium]
MSLKPIAGLPIEANRSMLRATMTYGGGWGRAFGHWLFGDPNAPFPRTGYEVLLLPCYFLTLIWAAFLILGVRAWWGWLFVGAGLLIGSVGLVYPTRRLVGGSLVVYWWALIVANTIAAPDQWALGLLVLMVDIGFIPLCHWAERRRDKTSRTSRQRNWFSRHDASMANVLGPLVLPLRTEIPQTVPGVLGTKTFTGLRAGEVTRHFDSQVEAAINGMLRERTTSKGSGISFSSDFLTTSASTGVSNGQGRLELGARGSIREDWTNENFIAVLETTGQEGPDVLRLVVPSAASVHDYVRELVWSWQRSLGVNSSSE